MRARPATPSPPAAPRLAGELGRRWRRYEWERRRLEGDAPTVPVVHDCRVAGRRLMTLLRLIERIAPRHGACGLRRRVRRSFGALARLRDVQVEQALAEERAQSHPVLLRLVRRLRREEARLRRAARAALGPGDLRDQQRRCAALLYRWERQGGPGACTISLRRELRRELRAHADTVVAGNAAAREGDPDSLHQVRVALKKFRYLLEAARSLEGAAFAAPLARARRWQTRLGRLQDLRVLRDDARTQAAAFPDPAWKAALAALEAELAAGTRAYLRVRSHLTGLVTPFSRHGKARPAG